MEATHDFNGGLAVTIQDEWEDSINTDF